MKLYVMRHGPAGNRGDVDDDFQRPLTSDGRKETALVARGLKRLRIGPVTLVSSPLARSRQTAELVARELTPGEPPQIADGLASGATPGEILRAARSHPGDVLICGHDPDFSALLSYLLTGSTNPFVDFSKSGVAAIEFAAEPKRASGSLLWYLRRRQLVLLGE